MISKGRFTRSLWAIFVLLGMTLVIAWFAGAFHHKLAPGKVTPGLEMVGGREALLITPVPVVGFESAIGSVRAVHETAVGSRILARVEKVCVKAGAKVKQGDILIELDDEDLKAKVAGAEQEVRAAQANYDQAVRERQRNRELHRKKILADNDWDRIQSAAKNAEAALGRTRESLQETKTMLSYSTVKAPLSGLVVDKKVDVGDMAVPGQVLITLYDPTRMQLWTNVRESLAMKLRPGDKVDVSIAVAKGLCSGVVDEVVPAMDVGSRTFLVKVSGPCHPGIYKGMYGKLLLPTGTRLEIHIPDTAVGRVGQLTQVKVLTPDGAVQRRFVRLGRMPAKGRELVLSGLSAGERILKKFSAPPRN